MLIHLKRSVIVSFIFFVMLGLVYPFATTGISQVLFNHQANGSLSANGSTLIGQSWSGPSWFHGRPDPYTPAASGPSNLGPKSKALKDQISKEISYWHKLGVNPTPDLVEGSGSGLDPDISPQGAYAQVPMIVKARHIPVTVLDELISKNIHNPQFGFLGSAYVNVLTLNTALAKLK